MTALRFAVALLGCLCGMSAALPAARADGAVSPRAANVRAEVQSILSAPEYRQSNPGKSFVERLGDILWAPIRRFLTWLRRKLGGFDFPEPSGPLGQILATIVYALLAAGVVYLLGRLIVALIGARTAGGRRARGSPSVQSSAIDELDPAVEPDAWVGLARELAERGDLRGAYRAAFTALLVRLDRMGALRFERQRTNGEYLRALRARPALFAAVKPVVRDFDQRWYGGVDVTQKDFMSMLAAYEGLAAETAA